MGDGVRFPKTQGLPPGGAVIGELGEIGEQRESQHVVRTDATIGDLRGPLFKQEEPSDVDPLGIGRASRGGGKEIPIFGEKLGRAAPAIKIPRALENGVADLLGGLFANRGLLSDGKRIEDYRHAGAVRAALDLPKVAEGSPLGPLTIFRPGLGNTAPGPAQIARLAQYTDKLIIAYANPGQGAEARLRPVDEVDGVPLPPELRGKVFAIGSPKNLMISFEQASDLFLEQLEKMKRSPHLEGIDLATSKATVVAHSQGGLDALLTRKRLEDAKLGDTFGKLVTLATPFRGSPVANENMVGLITEVGQRAFDLQSMGAVNALDPQHVARVIGEDDQRLVDLSLIGQTESGKAGRGDIRTFFKVTDAAIEAVKSLASLFQGRDARENDGLVTVSSQKFGRQQLVLEKSYDHAGIAEDASVIDTLVKKLAAAGR